MLRESSMHIVQSHSLNLSHGSFSSANEAMLTPESAIVHNRLNNT